MEFRVWDKKKKKWMHENIYLNPNGELLKANKSVLGWTKPTFISEDRYVYQKAIGLNDKNGTMIYIGDYLEAQVAENRVVTGIVTFAEELSAYIILCFDTDEFFTLGTEICEYIQVIGNVFEEPKKKKNKHEEV